MHTQQMALNHTVSIQTINKALEILEPIAFTDSSEVKIQATRQAAKIIGNEVLRCVQQERPEAANTKLASVEFIAYRYFQDDSTGVTMQKHTMQVKGPQQPVVWNLGGGRQQVVHTGGDHLHTDRPPPYGSDAYTNAGNGGLFALHMQNVGTYYFPSERLGKRMTTPLKSKFTDGKTAQEIHDYLVQKSQRQQLQVGEMLPVNSIFHVAPEPYDGIDITKLRWLARVWIKGHNLQLSNDGSAYNFREQLIAKPFKFCVHLKD